jgi:hypothetical protein
MRKGAGSPEGLALDHRNDLHVRAVHAGQMSQNGTGLVAQTQDHPSRALPCQPLQQVIEKWTASDGRHDFRQVANGAAKPRAEPAAQHRDVQCAQGTGRHWS